MNLTSKLLRIVCFSFLAVHANDEDAELPEIEFGQSILDRFPEGHEKVIEEGFSELGLTNPETSDPETREHLAAISKTILREYLIAG